MKDHHYKPSSAFQTLHQSKKNQTQQFINTLINQPNQKHNAHPKTTNNLFKLNIKSNAVITQSSQNMSFKPKEKLQSLLQQSNSQKKAFSIFDNESKQGFSNKVIKDKMQFIKKYNIDISALNQPQLIKQIQEQNEHQQQGYLKPSQIYQTKQVKGLQPYTLFQTPILPCFKSQVYNKLEDGQSKIIKEGEGVWKIGKIKIKGNKAVMKIGNIQFDGQLASSQGRAGVLNNQTLYQLPNWKGIWVFQPKDQLFTYQ